MTACVIPFPASRAKRPPSTDPLDALADRLTRSIAELPPADADASTLKLLRAIDTKLGRLVKALEPPR
ncbi:MAG: hypothetical protein Q8R10_16945 [Pseudomonas sp.]|uniref:hypothetical protein n=1 Tax=Pseudomonas sp. TaxID=306 RepID=UPI002733AF35|nr:hypothetical protein [Pseudomonas sp.]MDP3848104.1 hypothetical protein [Pseudomonas sp.]